MRFLILMVWGLFATAATSQTAPQTPVTEQVTVTVYGPWTHGFRTSDTAEAHLRDHPYVYVKSAATTVGNEMDGRPISWKLVSVEFKSKGDASHFPFKARAKVEVTLDPWSVNVPKEVAEAEAAAEASGEKPIENELDQRIAELEALDAEMSDAVVDKLTSDLLDKINDIDVMRNTLVSVIARLNSKGPALGLWKGGKTAHRYISRLEETVARVQQVEASLTGLHDHSMLKASSLFDGLMRDLDALDSEIGVQSTWGDGDPDVAAFWEAKHALRDAVKTAEKQALSYDIGMSGEQHASTFRALKRQDKINELRKNDFLKREYGIDPDKDNATPAATVETREADQTSKVRERLKSQLSPALSPEALQDDPTEDQPEAAPMRNAKKHSPLRTSSQSDKISEMRRQAGAATDTRTMDAEAEGPNQANSSNETAPRVETPRVTSPFVLAREQKERAAQQALEETATLRFNELAWLEIDGQISDESSVYEERYVVFGGWRPGDGHSIWEQCTEARYSEFKRRKDAFYEKCPGKNHSSVRNRHENILYQNLQKTCPGYYYVEDRSYGHYYPADAKSAGAPEYQKWQMNELYKRIQPEVNEQYGCGEEPKRSYVRYGEPVHVLVPVNQLKSIQDTVGEWAKKATQGDAGAKVYTSLSDAPDIVPDQLFTAPDLTNAPFTLYEDSALKELRDMQQEYQY